MFLGLFLWEERRSHHPILDVAFLVKNKAFALSTLASFINYSSIFGVTFYFSLYLQGVHGLTLLETGLLLSAQPAVQVFISPLGGRMADRHGADIIATIGIAGAEELRPGSRVSVHTRQEWLREADGMLRERFFKASDTDAFDTVGADRAWDDGLQDEDVLLAPAPFDALYPHYLCAMTDAALGETDRYAGEQAQYNGILAELAAWLRRTYPPRACTRWQW